MEKKGLRVNMGKTKIMESGFNLDVLKKSGKYPCGVCLTGVGSTNLETRKILTVTSVLSMETSDRKCSN